MYTEDTIVAIATPPGRGGLGVVRLSGARAFVIASELVTLPSLPLETQRATLGQFRDPKSGRRLDEVIVTGFRRPHSYTAEDVVEMACHGAPVVLAYLVECCLDRGARPAEPGEFTLRAFLNGRIDLTQAEAVRDLIESRTLYQARLAAAQMEGSLSARLKPHKQALVELMARLEAGIDFAEDDLPVSGWDEIIHSLERVRGDLETLAVGFAYGRVVHDGLSLAIVGRPNVGKSSLFNRLLKQDRAIVTSTPGTTRDLVAEQASMGGIPLRFVDTAGIRETEDETESLGVKKSFEAIADADLRLLVLDAAEGWTAADQRLFARIQPLGALVVACNKSDLPSRLDPTELDRALAQETATSSLAQSGGREKIVWTSALTGDGLARLSDAILEAAAPACVRDSGGELITNLRHHQLLKAAVQSLERAHRAAHEHVHHEMLLLDLYDALHSLDAITGATTVDDLLGVIFSTFCLGK